MLGAVDMTAEMRALVGELATVGERKYLEAAAVGEDGFVPAGEPVEPPQLPDDPVPRGGCEGGRCCTAPPGSAAALNRAKIHRP